MEYEDDVTQVCGEGGGGDLRSRGGHVCGDGDEASRAGVRARVQTSDQTRFQAGDSPFVRSCAAGRREGVDERRHIG